MARDYTTLVTSAYRAAPRFMSVVGLLAGSAGQIADASLSLRNAFNVDVAIGVQLDAIGRWVGFSRQQSIPIAGVYFTWDDADLGWNFASWKGPFEPTEGAVTLDDDTYRALLKAKIASNYWSGTFEAVQTIGEHELLGLGVQTFVLDNQDMSIDVYIIGTPSALLLEMMKRGYIPPKPAGVRITGYILASTPGAPFFGLDAPPPSGVAGLDFGAFEA